jgi:protein-S-isoprenylcysteine O-methyltransferase Ste14
MTTQAVVQGAHPDPAGRFTQSLVRRRRFITLLVVVPLVFFMMVSHHSWADQGWMDIAVTSAGFALVMVCAFGRLWTSLFIGGYQTKTLIRVGPYSVVRHPLYFFSLLGAIGLSLAAENVVLVAAMALLYGVYYPMVIRTEERKLALRHPLEWPEYAAATPRFIPRLTLYREPESYVIHPAVIRREFLDASVFPILLVAVHVIEMLQEMHVLPVYFSIP